jgi:hypothetical protein
LLLYISIPISFISYDFISIIDLSSLPLPSNLTNWASWHFNEESYAKAILREGSSGYFWVGISFVFIRQIAYAIIPIVLWKFKDEINKRKDGIKNLFSFFLFYFAIVNFIQSVPVLGERSYFISRILAIYLWFKIIYPRYNKYLLFILLSCSLEIFSRYFYKGAVASSVPLDIFYSNLPQLIMDFWGVTK